MALLITCLLTLPAAYAEKCPSYNVVWDAPSKDSIDSMPLSGRLGAGANVWVQDGSLWLYLGHSGAYDEEGRLLKLGCVRITPVQNPFIDSVSFRQELDLANGTIRIAAETREAGKVNFILWFATETLMIEASCDKPQAFDAAFATWRDQKRGGLKLDVWGTFTVQPDQVVADADGFVWSHRNADYSFDVAGLAKSQGIPVEALYDPTSRRIFGGAVAVAGGISAPVESAVKWQSWEGKAWTGRTTSRERHLFAIALRAQRDGQPAEWRKEAQAALAPDAVLAAKAEQEKRWAAFWDRSHIFVNPGAKADDVAWQIGRNYQLFRYMLACNRGGELPLLFNGGIFTTDDIPGRITGNNNDELITAPGAPCTPDFRRWIGCRFMSQNQRWLGWPTLATGDADLLAPSLAFYRDRAKTAAARAHTLGADGVVYPEPLDVWGLCCVGPRPDGLCGAQHLTYHFSMMLEHAWMALQAHDALGIPLDKDLSWIEDVVFFYDSFYRDACRKRTGNETDADGKLVIFPSNGLEYAGGATNPIEVVSGLRRITAGLLALPDLAAASRSRLEEIRKRLPELPTGERDGKRSLLPAKSYESEYNKWEPIEMYAAWPYRLVGVTQPETLQLARDTWETVPADRARLCKQDFSWMANLANMAALALPEEAKRRAIYKLANPNAQARFPAFFGPGHDWLPDHNWGGAGMTGLQEMLVSPEPGPKGKIHLFPAWPREWDVDFKLHAPGQTVIEGVLRDGKLVSLKVTPKSRAGDVVNWLDKTPPVGKTYEDFSLQVVNPNGRVVIGSNHTDLQGNKHGFEGGCALREGNAYHLFTAEMWGDPFWVAMRLGHWKSSDLNTWERVGTLFESKGKGFENDPKYSIWSPMAVYNDAENRWNLFYVCYRGALTPNEGTHMDGKIYRAVSKKPGRDGLDGPYEDAGVFMQPDAQTMPWEGQQGVDSFYPYPVGDRWYSHYGSHNYNPVGPWLVGLASASSLAGPWKRITDHSPLPFEKEFIENPIVSRIGSYYVAVYDSSTIEAGSKYVEDAIHIGYSYSRDGIDWAPGKRLAIHADDAGKANWAADIRTPLGLIPLDDNRFALLYTAKEKEKQFWNVGLVTVEVKAEPEN